LANLELPSLQGDAIIAGWFESFGVKTVKSEGGLKLIKIGSQNLKSINLNFIENPDIAQTMAVLCVARKISFHFSGLETLKIKETDRIAALQKELAKFGATLVEPGIGELAWNGHINLETIQENPVISTYHDHRMALAFAPLAMAGFTFQIEDPLVVTKSYPGFWNDLERIGFRVTEV